MKFSHKKYGEKLPETELLILPCPQGTAPALPESVEIPAVARADFDGEFRQVRSTDALSGKAKRVLLVGLGKDEDVDAEKLRRAAALGVQKAEELGAKSATLFLDDSVAVLCGGHEESGCAVAEGAILGSYRYDLGKSEPKPRKLERVLALGRGAAFQKGAARGETLAEASSFARDLQNRAGNQATPRFLAAEAQRIARRSERIACRVLDEAAMKRLGMGLLLGVAAGSDEPARLIHLEYRPKGRSKGRIAFVGKGLTFDTGGISLKPAAKLEEMRYDMSGGAAVLGLFHALARLDVPFEVHGIVPSTENMPGGDATKPGDVHRSMDGKTVEVINTDAEGRLILGDALAYAVKKVRPDTVVDIATLTGAVVMALGHEVSGLYATTERLRDALVAAGEATGERLWPLPLLDGHAENLKAGPADLRNICTPDMGGGSIAGAVFLHQFVGDAEWAHLDVAGSAWAQKARDYVGGNGGTGVGVRLFLRYLLDRP